jgi:hypothetical protein
LVTKSAVIDAINPLDTLPATRIEQSPLFSVNPRRLADIKIRKKTHPDDPNGSLAYIIPSCVPHSYQDFMILYFPVKFWIPPYMAEKAQNRLFVPHIVAPYMGKSGDFCHKWPHMGVGFKLAETKVIRGRKIVDCA